MIMYDNNNGTITSGGGHLYPPNEAHRAIGKIPITPLGDPNQNIFTNQEKNITISSQPVKNVVPSHSFLTSFSVMSNTEKILITGIVLAAVYFLFIK